MRRPVYRYGAFNGTLKEGVHMAEVEKHTSEAMVMIMKHNERELKNDANKDILKERSHLNYSVPLDHGGLTDRQYFKKIVDDSYLYGRGSSREAEAVTSFSWVITLPKEVSDYTVIDKTVTGYLNPSEEKAFFEGAVKFVSDRYGAENLLHNKIHYDEAGQPHIHIYVVPRKELDHDLVHYKTVKTKEAIQTDTGRWEFKYRYKLDANGERIPIKNYAKMSDYYDTKLSCKEIINTVELKHFHPDLAEYLRKNNLPGASGVHTGVTGGKNISVNAMKEFTKTTGMTIEEAKTLQQDQNLLKSKVATLNMDVTSLQSEVAFKDRYISSLKDRIHTMETSIDQNKDVVTNIEKAREQLLTKEKELSQTKEALSVKETELSRVQQNYESLQTRYQTLKSSLTVSQAELVKAQNTIKTMRQEQTVNASGLEAKDRQIEALQQQVSTLKEQLRSVEETRQHDIEAKDKEIERLKEEKSVTKEATREWGDTSGWGKVSGWGTVERSDKTWNMEQGNN